MKKAWEVWNELLAKPEAARSPTERIVVQVNTLLIDFENGSWLYNISPGMGQGRQWHRLRQAAKSVGAVGISSIARALAEIADTVETADVQQDGTWGEFLVRADPEKRIEGLERSISANLPAAWAKLEEFTVEHFGCEPGA